MPVSEGLKQEQDFKKHEQRSDLSDDALSQLQLLKERISNAKTQRDQKRREFNGLDFITDDQANLDFGNSYIRPKKNDDEVRITSGTGEKKMMTVCNEILSLNIQPEVQCFDENDKMIQETGEVMQNILKRSYQQEPDNDAMPAKMLWDLATRRMLVMQEYQESRTVIDKRKKKYDLEKGDIEYTTQEWTLSRPRRRKLDPRSVLFGNFTIPASQNDNQPFIVLYDYKDWRDAQTIFGKFKNWKYVREGQAMDGDTSWFGGQFDWRLFGVGANQVEILYYWSFPDDEYQIIVNSVPMLPSNCPLDYEHEGYNIVPYVFREFDHLTAGQLFSINAKVLVGVHDEMLRLIVRKWRKSMEPTVIFKGKKVLSRDIFNSGATINGVDPKDIGLLDPNGSQGLNNADIEGWNLMAQKIEEEIGVSRLMQGMDESGKRTATQILNQMKQAIKAIGPLVFAWTRVVTQMAYLRIYNVIENNTSPIDIEFQDGKVKQKFNSYTISDTKLDNNTTGSMMVQMTNQDTPPEMQQAIYEYEEAQAKQGNHVRFKLINVEKLRSIRARWYVTSNSQEMDSTALQKILLTDELNQAEVITQMTGRKVSGDTVVNTFERLYKAKNFFEKAPDPATVAAQKAEMMKAAGLDVGDGVRSRMDALTADGMQNGGQSVMGGQIDQAVSNSVKRPSINSATQ